MSTECKQTLMTTVAQQPVSIAIETDQSSFHLYSHDVLTAACGTQLDHGVLAVEYRTIAGIARTVISETTGGAESFNHGLIKPPFEGVRKIRELAKSEYSLVLAQLAYRVASPMHAESLNGDDPFLVKALLREFRTKSSKATLDSQRSIRVKKEYQHMAHDPHLFSACHTPTRLLPLPSDLTPLHSCTVAFRLVLRT